MKKARFISRSLSFIVRFTGLWRIRDNEKNIEFIVGNDVFDYLGRM